MAYATTEEELQGLRAELQGLRGRMEALGETVQTIALQYSRNSRQALTRRDQFAQTALVGILTGGKHKFLGPAVFEAYQCADEMLAAARVLPEDQAEIQAGNDSEQEPEIPVNVAKVASELMAFAKEFGLREDWHEPDEQEVTCIVYGGHLDNAGVGQEYVVQLSVEGKPTLRVNLADLLATAAALGRKLS